MSILRSRNLGVILQMLSQNITFKIFFLNDVLKWKNIIMIKKFICRTERCRPTWCRRSVSRDLSRGGRDSCDTRGWRPKSLYKCQNFLQPLPTLSTSWSAVRPSPSSKATMPKPWTPSRLALMPAAKKALNLTENEALLSYSIKFNLKIEEIC